MRFSRPLCLTALCLLYIATVTVNCNPIAIGDNEESGDGLKSVSISRRVWPPLARRRTGKVQPAKSLPERIRPPYGIQPLMDQKQERKPEEPKKGPGAMEWANLGIGALGAISKLVSTIKSFF